MPQRKIERVSDEHTRDRVRDNQRRHRARRRDYIVTLEGKLKEAERTISSLKEHIKELQGGNSALDVVLPKENMDSTMAGASDSMVAGSATENYDFAEPVLGNLVASMSPSTTSPTLIPSPMFAYPTPSYSSETTTYETNIYSLPSLQVPVPIHPLMTTNSPCQESTILCSEAYILIAHQNHKHLSESTIAAFLWPSFRASTSPSEGCRVATSTLYTLLAFISNPPNDHQQLF
ncbi:unnamed protein product [Fusarium equiseti]|uniref:BZIP domain-containing protein n=1 Tax=Fusarium equiseti TaxID=61235 RepID=A0A8J2ISV6_FUSEQ|nr:unnamed protein product [Fusarium equiseti]